MWYNSANRDEAVFDDPERFDVRRTPNDHVGFGGPGPHFCLGAHLARREITVMFRELFRRLPDLQVTGEPAACARTSSTASSTCRASSRRAAARAEAPRYQGPLPPYLPPFRRCAHRRAGGRQLPKETARGRDRRLPLPAAHPCRTSPPGTISRSTRRRASVSCARRAGCSPKWGQQPVPLGSNRS